VFFFCVDVELQTGLRSVLRS